MGRGPVTAQREPTKQREPTSGIVLFALAVLLAGWIGRLLDEVTRAGDDAGIGQLVWIVAPIATAAGMPCRCSSTRSLWVSPLALASGSRTSRWMAVGGSPSNPS